MPDHLLLDRRALLVAAGMSAAAPQLARAASWDAVVSKSGRSGTLATIAAALAQARSAARPYRILVERGLYEEKLRIDVPGLYLAGEGEATVISFSAAANMLDPQGVRWGTGGSATLTVAAPEVILADCTIRNGFDYLEDFRAAGNAGPQAVALALGQGADRSLIRNCIIEGYQDTLYVREGRALFSACRITGSIDFIFGGSAALFERCEIRARATPGRIVPGFIAAPSTPASQPIGLVFHRCRLTRESGLPDASMYLGRPWRAGGNMQLTGSATYLECWMDAHIRPDGWTWMGYRDPAGVQRRLTPQEARLAEWGSTGPGAGTTMPTRRILTPAEAGRFGRKAILGDWRPNI